ncbi:M24 family metallopeptidase [Aestuariivita boseongensis]|uniref:M24 family metallopeptidase n=1 Tax=Aestuariivita boseongensis TaxID=1470562 RepID=UPI000A6D61DF|nr:Xaa-Pro peptidase family protein [Aestuariivita boseongensis]
MIFAQAEYEARTARAQAEMARQGFDALLLTTEPEVRYFTGFLTRFWESPTRPWFVIVPRQGRPVAVIPSIGAPLMARGWVTDIRTWRAPDLEDDGITLLVATLRELAGRDGQIATPTGHETHMRLPLSDLDRVRNAVTLVSDGGLMRALRLVKSAPEIAKIRAACAIADRAFARVPEIARAAVGLDQVFRRFQMLCLDEGADWVPYLAGAAEAGGYADVISPAGPEPLCPGDLLMLDTGLVREGYFCDFDRNFSVGPPSAAVADAHATLIAATSAGFDAARPGATAADLFHAMDVVCTGGAGGSDAGRLGHGLGMQLTEWPSLIPADQTVLKPGMVLTLEPGVDLGGGRIMVHEENIVITDEGAEWLSTPRGPDIEVLDG